MRRRSFLKLAASAVFSTAVNIRVAPPIPDLMKNQFSYWYAALEEFEAQCIKLEIKSTFRG